MDTYVRVLTGQARGAISVVRIWGPAALSIVDSVFRPRQAWSLRETVPGRLRLGRVGRGLGDEVVCVRLPGEPVAIEIQCHGGSAAVQSVTTALTDAGARMLIDSDRDVMVAEDRLHTEAMADLPHAPTLRTAEILMDQARGVLRSRIDELRVEALSRSEVCRDELDRLIRRAGIGLRLLSGWKVVIAGRPNVGKSRLFNALAGFSRTIVDPTPGVTRDVVSIATAVDGWPIELSDTAGIRLTDDPVERIGIDRSNTMQEHADLVLLVLDRSERLQVADHELLISRSSAIVMANKCDLPAAWSPGKLGTGHRAMIAVSAETGEGLTDLIRAIGDRLVPDPPAPGDAIPFRAAQVAGLENARACLAVGDRAGAARELASIGDSSRTEWV
jgi:tRNA modification GTPase